MRMPLGKLHADSWNLHTKDACLGQKNYSIMTDHVNANTFQGQDGTDGTSFCPTGQRKCVHLSLSSKQENMNKYGHDTKRKLKEKAIPQRYLRSPSSQFLLSMTR